MYSLRLPVMINLRLLLLRKMKATRGRDHALFPLVPSTSLDCSGTVSADYPETLAARRKCAVGDISALALVYFGTCSTLSAAIR
jgi:hypothetical protein